MVQVAPLKELQVKQVTAEDDEEGSKGFIFRARQQSKRLFESYFVNGQAADAGKESPSGGVAPRKRDRGETLLLLPQGRPNPSTLTGMELWVEYRVIDPKWKMKKRFDMVMVLLLLFIAFVTPFEVAFLEPSPQSAFFAINICVDCCFLLDIFVNLVTAYVDPETNKMVLDNKLIVKQYLRGWFTIDLISILPVDALVNTTSVSDGIRVLRLIKLLRLGRVQRLLDDGLFNDATSAIDYNLYSLFTFIFMLFLFSHWMACTWKLIPALEPKRSHQDDWLEYYGYTGSKYRTETKGVFEVYVVSMYWSVMTVTTIGYGDVVPSTSVERLFAILAMLMGGLIFGYIIGAVGNIVQQRSAKENEYYTGLNNLNCFMTDIKLPRELQSDISSYYKRLQDCLDVSTYLHYAGLLSPTLKGKMLMYTNQNWVSRVQHFKGAPEPFIVEVATVMTRHLYTPREVVLTHGAQVREMYIVNKGIAAGNNRLFTIGHILGNDALVRMDSATKRNYSAHAITFLECSRLDKDKLMLILEDYPNMKKRFRMLAIQNVFREEVFAYCVAMRTVRAKARSTIVNGHHLSPAHSRLAQDSFERRASIDFGESTDSTRVADLFNKTARTEFYTSKLELLHPATTEEKKKLSRSATVIQRMIRRKMSERRTVTDNNMIVAEELGSEVDASSARASPLLGPPQSAAASPDFLGPLPPPAASADPRAALRTQLKVLAENQQRMMMWMDAVQKQHTSILEDVTVIRSKINEAQVQFQDELMLEQN